MNEQTIIGQRATDIEKADASHKAHLKSEWRNRYGYDYPLYAELLGEPLVCDVIAPRVAPATRVAPHMAILQTNQPVATERSDWHLYA